jgi:hypothetical protein
MQARSGIQAFKIFLFDQSCDTIDTVVTGWIPSPLGAHWLHTIGWTTALVGKMLECAESAPHLLCKQGQPCQLIFYYTPQKRIFKIRTSINSQYIHVHVHVHATNALRGTITPWCNLSLSFRLPLSLSLAHLPALPLLCLAAALLTHTASRHASWLATSYV